MRSYCVGFDGHCLQMIVEGNVYGVDVLDDESPETHASVVVEVPYDIGAESVHQVMARGRWLLKVPPARL